MDYRYLIIAIVVVALVAVIDGLIVFFILRNKKKKRREEAANITSDVKEQPAAEVAEDEPGEVPVEEPVEEPAPEEPAPEETDAEQLEIEEQPAAEVAEDKTEEEPVEEPAPEETDAEQLEIEEQPAAEVAEDKTGEEPVEEPAPEETVEEQVIAEEQSAEEEQPEAEQSESEAEESECELRMVEENGVTRYIVIKYSKSFRAKVIQSDATTKSYYSEIKNFLLSYKNVKSRVSWRWETFRFGRKALAKLRLRGKTLSICLALNADDYADTKYIVENISDVLAYVDTPCLYRIKNDRRVRYAKELIDEVMRQSGVEKKADVELCDYVAQHPFETTEALIERKLIKVLTDAEAQSGTKFKPAEVKTSVTVQEADSLLQDDIAEMLVEDEGGESDRTRTGIVNIDTLSQYFADGEMVTLDEVKKRVPKFDKKTTYLKVLARGALDKKLTVEADSFSLQAVKMIVLTGGKVLKK